MRLRVPAFLLVALGLLALRLASSATASATFFLLAAYAFTGRMQAIQALALSWLFSMLSDGVAPEASMASLGRYAVLFAAALSVLLRSARPRAATGAPMRRLVLVTLLVGMGMLVHSLLFSPMRDVSALKAISWTLAVTTLLSAWSGLGEAAREQLERQLFGMLIAILLASLPLVASGRGYLVNGTGFQGVLAHPQAFGPTVAMLGAWLGSRIVADRRPPWRLVGLFVLCLVMIVLSEARTAGLGLLLGLMFAALVGRILARRRLRDYLPGLRSRRVQMTIGLGLLVVIAASPFLGQRVGAYLAKRSGTSNVVEAYDRSRGSKVEEMWANIRAHPLRGIGFGVASDPFTMEVKRDPVLGLPTGASIEKGVVFLAAWEELGLLGFMAVMGWLWVLVRRAARGGMTPLTVALTALLMNFGEATLFSPSGMGILSLILLAWAATARMPCKGGARG
ncbi:O-antigen ligase family protein [Thermomonas sp.]|uniref:O-antigen ligase family protein n=1 Tax=Thermomonas sp. TaxID=1971895 RepID=UPI001AD35C7A|nr:O-antigen ligase family protein [Xanthomonadales bacterium]MBN8794111.1 O-antigen ligase family protein [Stenotrophomonas nitritireducens]